MGSETGVSATLAKLFHTGFSPKVASSVFITLFGPSVSLTNDPAAVLQPPRVPEASLRAAREGERCSSREGVPLNRGEL